MTTAERKSIGARDLIALTRMRTLYAHRAGNPDIKDILQVTGDNKQELAEIGEAMIHGDAGKFREFFKAGRIKKITGQPVAETNAVYCLYVPPYYVFCDLKRKYK